METKKELQNLEQEIAAKIEEAVEYTSRSLNPSASEVLEDLFS